MSEPWFNEQWAFLPGTLLGVLGGLYGALAGCFAWQGKAKRLVAGLFWFMLIGSALLLLGGVAALVAGQPSGVWYGLGLAGFIGVIVLGATGPAVFRVYRQAEMRRLEARDF